MGLNNSFRFYNYTTATSDINVWKSISTYSSNETGFQLVNQGKTNDMATAVSMEFLLTETAVAPATSQSGIILQTGDNVSMSQLNTFDIWIRTPTTDASIEYVEWSEGGL